MIVIFITITFSLLFEIEIVIETEIVMVVPRKGWKRHPFSSSGLLSHQP